MDNLRVAARDYWTLRNAGELGETRTRAHNVLLDEMTRCKIEYEDREDAAQIAGEMIEERSNPPMTYDSSPHTPHTSKDTPQDTSQNAPYDILALALEGAMEEAEANRKSRQAANIANCNKPFWFYNPLTKQVQCVLPTCKHWTCEHCNQVRATDEQSRMDRALDEHKTVYAVFDIGQGDWLQLSKKFKSANITKDMYRRLPQDDNLVTVFFVGELKSSSMMMTEISEDRFRNSLESDDLDNPWYDLARKRPKRRTSGNLGAPPPEEPDGPELTSVKIVSVHGDGVSGKDQLSAQDQATAQISEIDAQDKEHLESLIEQWADTYEGALRKLGYQTHRLRVWRKMDLTAICTPENGHGVSSIVDKPYEFSQELAQEHLWPRNTVEI